MLRFTIQDLRCVLPNWEVNAKDGRATNRRTGVDTDTRTQGRSGNLGYASGRAEGFATTCLHCPPQKPFINKKIHNSFHYFISGYLSSPIVLKYQFELSDS